MCRNLDFKLLIFSAQASGHALKSIFSLVLSSTLFYGFVYICPRFLLRPVEWPFPAIFKSFIAALNRIRHGCHYRPSLPQRNDGTADAIGL